MNRIISLSLLAVGIATVILPQPILAGTYNFNALSPGLLSGQDNWMTAPSNTSDVITNGTGFNTSRVAQNPGSSGGGDVHLNGRQNNGNYSFGNLSGFAIITLGFDTQVQNNASQDQFINFSLSTVGLNTYSSPAFAYRQSFGGTPTWGLGGASYTGGPAAGAANGNLPGGINTNDWIRLQLVMTMTANAGVGSGNLFFNNLTQGGGTQVLASNFSLNLNPVGNVGLWDTMWSRSDFDSSVVIDNLAVTPTPEPSTWLMVAGGVGAFCARRARRNN